MGKSVAFRDVVNVIPERPEKPVSVSTSAWTKNFAATSRVTTNLFNRVRPSSAFVSASDAANERDSVATQGRFAVIAPENGTAAHPNGATTHGASPPEKPGFHPSGTTPTDEMPASAARDLQARAKKFQKAMPRIGPRWLSGSISSNSVPVPAVAPAGNEAALLALGISAPQPAPSISPPMTPEQTMLAGGPSALPKRFQQHAGVQSQFSGHTHSASLPAFGFPVTPPQVDVPSLGEGAGSPQPNMGILDRTVSSQQIHNVATSNSVIPGKAPLRSCLKGPTPMFFAEMSVFVRMNHITSGEVSAPVQENYFDPASLSPAAHQTEAGSPQAPLIRGLATDRPWHRTEGPPVLSRQSAYKVASRSPEQEYPSADGIISASSMPMLNATQGQHQLAPPFPVPQRTPSPGAQRPDGQQSGGHDHSPTGGIHSSASAGPLSDPAQTSVPGPPADASGTWIVLNSECACKDCIARILHGLSPSYTPSWTQIARNKYLADRAQERKVREQGMDADMRLALRGLEETTKEWLEGRNLESVTDAELAALNADDLISGLLDVHMEEEEEEEEEDVQPYTSPPVQVIEDAPTLDAPYSDDSSNTLLSANGKVRHNSISPKPSFSSQSTLDPTMFKQWPSKPFEAQSTSSSGSCSPKFGPVHVPHRHSSQPVRGPVSLHSRTASQEFPPPSPSAAATAYLNTPLSAGLKTSADEDPELKAALATPPLSRRTSFGSATFRALNRRASLESLRDAKRRNSISNLQPQAEDEKLVETAERDDEGSGDEDYGSAETSAVVVIEEPGLPPLLSALSPAKATPAGNQTRAVPAASSSAMPPPAWALDVATPTGTEHVPMFQNTKLDLALTVPVRDSEEEEENIRTPVATEFGAEDGKIRQNHDGGSRRGHGEDSTLQRASWAPSFVMRGLIKERTQRRGSDVGAGGTAPPPVVDGEYGMPPANWDRRPSDSQNSETSVYVDARQSSIGHLTSSSHVQNQPSVAGMKISAHQESISEKSEEVPVSFSSTTLSSNRASMREGANVNGMFASWGGPTAFAPASEKVGQSESTSNAASPNTSRPQSPQMPKLTLADRRRARKDSLSTEVPIPSVANGSLSIDLTAAVKLSQKPPPYSADDNDTPPDLSSKANPVDQKISSSISDSWHASSSSHDAQTMYPAAIAQYVRQSGPSTQTGANIGSAATQAGWSVESLPIPPSINSRGGGMAGSASASVESLHATLPSDAKGQLQPSSARRTGAEDEMETLMSPMGKPKLTQKDSYSGNGNGRNSRSNSPESVRNVGLGIGKRVKDLFGNSRSHSKGFFPSNVMSSPSPLSSGFGSFGGGEGVSHAPGMENEPLPPSPATPGGTKFRAFDKFTSAVRRGRQSTAERLQSSSSKKSLSPSTPKSNFSPQSDGAPGSASDGFFPVNKVRSAEPLSAMPKPYATAQSAPAVPTLATTKDRESTGGKESGGWKPRLGRSFSGDAIREALSGGSSTKDNHASTSSAAHANGYAHGSNGSNDRQHTGNGNHSNKKSSSSFAGAFLATLSQTGGGGVGVPLPTASASAYPRNRGNNGGMSRPGTSDGFGGDGFGGVSRSKSRERPTHRPAQSQGTFY
ncbi:hypothetical protein CF327_g3590 [Tilletia walkeri]|nr:hypothetical protein CF327_g3590 [Tilletia walkeri]